MRNTVLFAIALTMAFTANSWAEDLSLPALPQTTWTLPLQGQQAQDCINMVWSTTLELEKRFHRLEVGKGWSSFFQVVTVGGADKLQNSKRTEAIALRNVVERFAQSFERVEFTQSKAVFARRAKTSKELGIIRERTQRLVRDIPEAPTHRSQ